VKVIQFYKADLAIHQAVAVRANGLKVANFIGHRPAIRYRPCRGFGRAAAEAIELSCLARLLVPCPTSLKECGKVIPLTSNGRFPSLVGSPAFTHERTVFLWIPNRQAISSTV